MNVQAFKEKGMKTKHEDLLSGWQEIADYMDKKRPHRAAVEPHERPPRGASGGPPQHPHASKNALWRWAVDGSPAADFSGKGAETHAG
ncbi:MAG: hypothetical protein M5R36_26140 [Deltaproteobacteria bacterium]|nr:hypothetical protein [Deltaproteobacteria bacterium]